MSHQKPTSKQKKPQIGRLDTNSEIRRMRESLEGTVRVFQHMPLAIVIGQMIVTAIDVYSQTRSMQAREAMARQQAAEAPKTGPTGVVPAAPDKRPRRR